MIKKDTFTKIKKDLGDLKDKATKISQDTVKNASTVKQVLQTGVGTSKSVFDKASKVLSKEQIGTGIRAASKGIEIAAKGTQTLANTMDKASKGMRKISDTLKKN